LPLELPLRSLVGSSLIASLKPTYNSPKHVLSNIMRPNKGSGLPNRGFKCQPGTFSHPTEAANWHRGYSTGGCTAKQGLEATKKGLSDTYKGIWAAQNGLCVPTNSTID